MGCVSYRRIRAHQRSGPHAPALQRRGRSLPARDRRVARARARRRVRGRCAERAAPATRTPSSRSGASGSAGSEQAGYACVGWPREWGGRGASLTQQVIFHEEYARARGPGRLGHIGEGLLGPTLLAFGNDAQKRRFLPAIARGEEIWCQGYSEPDAGSDLANVQTRARLDGDTLGDRRSEGLDLVGAVGRLVLRALPQRRAGPEAPRALLPAGPDATAGHLGAPDRAAHRRFRVQRGLLRRRAHATPPTSSAGRARAGRWRWERSPSNAAPRRSVRT